MSIEQAELFKQIPLPMQDLGKLGFCNSNKPAQVKQWAEALPATQIQQSSSLLYKALPELTRLKTEPHSRLQMLESLRPYVQSCIQGLSKDFLNKPLILPEAAVKPATIAQALQKHMTSAYELVARDICLNDKKSNAKLQEQLTLSLHRAITGLGLQLLRSYQLYIPVQRKLWIQLHQLFQVAEYWDCANSPVEDPNLVHKSACTIQQAYCRVLLLACTRPNQLRQFEVGAIYSALELWSEYADLIPGATNRENLFVVNLSSDLPPMYKNRFRGNENNDIRELDTRKLISTIRKKMDGERDGSHKLSSEISDSILAHLNNAWCINRQRHFERRLSKGELEVAVGLTNLHYYLAGETPFKNFLLGTESGGRGASISSSIDDFFEVKTSKKPSDPWSDSFDAGGNKMSNTAAPMKKKGTAPDTSYQSNTISIQDTSPGGYCLSWAENIPLQVRAGEIIGLREPGRRSWSIGVIRWLSQLKGSSQLGIQVLSPQAQAIGVSAINTTSDGTDFLRALLLPEIKSINQPASLLTAAIPFKEQGKVSINEKGAVRKAQLVHQLLATGTVAQYSFRELETAEEKPSRAPRRQESSEPKKVKKTAPDDFDSLWD